MKKKKKKTGKKAAGWAVTLLVLALILLSVLRPEEVGAFLRVMGKGDAIRLTPAADRFEAGMDQVIRGLVLPEGEDPTLMTVVKTLGVEAAGMIATLALASAIFDRMDVSYGTALFYAYLPCTAVVFLVNGVGISNLYLLVSVIVLALAGLFGGR